MKRLIQFTIIYCLLSVAGFSQNNVSGSFPTGDWLGVISFNSTEPCLDVQFNFRHFSDYGNKEIVEIRNGEDRISATELSWSGDTVLIRLPVHQAEIQAICRNDTLYGTLYPRGKSENRKYIFKAFHNITDRFPAFNESPACDVTGRWKITENPGKEDESVMIGIFQQRGSKVTGTVLTTTGDYRYLEGKVSGSNFMLSCFDGGFCMAFKAEITKGCNLENGIFQGSTTWKSTWRAEKDDTAELPDSYSLVREKSGAAPFGFSFPDIKGNIVSLGDEQFRNKVVIVQIMGTWCANCKDETILFGEFYKKYRSRGLEIVALCFESKDRGVSLKRIQRFIDHTGAVYTFLYAGEATRNNRNNVLYDLEGSIAYPTSIFIGRNGKIRKVHSGFSGPATGKEYINYIDNTTRMIEQLLDENQ